MQNMHCTLTLLNFGIKGEMFKHAMLTVLLYTSIQETQDFSNLKVRFENTAWLDL